MEYYQQYLSSDKLPTFYSSIISKNNHFYTDKDELVKIIVPYIMILFI